MGFLSRLFGKKGATEEAATADRARSRPLAGREDAQSTDQQAATRSQMEAEMDAQRQRRDSQPPTGA